MSHTRTTARCFRVESDESSRFVKRVVFESKLYLFFRLCLLSCRYKYLTYLDTYLLEILGTLFSCVWFSKGTHLTHFSKWPWYYGEKIVPISGLPPCTLLPLCIISKVATRVINLTLILI